MINKILKKIIPPKSLNLYDYPSIKEAAKNSIGYQDDELIDIVIAKTKIYVESLRQDKVILDNRQTIQDAFILANLDAEKVDVIDIGGACGAKYFELERIMPEKINKWMVFETPKMALAGAKHFKQNKLEFYPIEKLAKINEDRRCKKILFASSVIQYPEDPDKFINELAGLGLDYIYLTRTPTYDNGDDAIYITVQKSRLSENGVGPLPKNFQDKEISYPRTLLPIGKIIENIQKNYDILFYFKECANNKAVINTNHHKKDIVIIDMGLFGRKK